MLKCFTIAIAVLLGGCAAKGSVSEIETERESRSVEISDIELNMPAMPIYHGLIEDRQVDEAAEYYEEFNEFNIPMAMTSRVSAYIRYYTKRVPATTQMWLDRSNKYMYLVLDIFIKSGLPTDLVVLAFTESGYNTHALSHAGAVGMWQFIPSTGRIYGMRDDFWVDERRDFEKATYAAVQYLNTLYDRFDDWYLALAAYNAGPGRIAKATRKHASNDFFTISKSRSTLKLETRDYVPKFLALLIIYKNYLKYGFNPPSEEPLLFTYIELPTQTNLHWLAKELGIDMKDLEDLNPELKLPITPPVAGYRLRVPYGMDGMASEIIASATADELIRYRIHNAKSGEKIVAIAKRYDATPQEIMKLNGFKYDTVFQGRPIFIPIAGTGDEVQNEQFALKLAALAPKYYKVKKGDTFIEIAHRHNMRQGDLQKLNPTIRASRIFPGQQLVVSRGSR